MHSQFKCPLSVVLLGCLLKIPFTDWLCTGPFQSVDSLAHILLQCPYELQLKLKWIMPCFGKWTMLPLVTVEQEVQYFLENSEFNHIYFVARSLEAAEKC